MSNFQPSISGSQIINPLPTLNNKPQVKVENTEHTSETQVHSKKSETQTQTPVKKVSEEPLPEPEVIKEKIDKTPSEQVLTLKQEIDSLKKTPLKLKHVDAPLDLSLERAKIEYLSNIQTDGQLPKNLNHVNKQQFQAIQSTQVSDRIIRKDKQGLDTLIQSHFAVFEHKLRDRLVSTDKQTAAAKELAKTLISQKDPDNEILLKINGLNDQDLLDLVAKNIGALRSDRDELDLVLAQHHRWRLNAHDEAAQAFLRKQVLSTRPLTFSTRHSTSSASSVRWIPLTSVPRLSVTDVPLG